MKLIILIDTLINLISSVGILLTHGDIWKSVGGSMWVDTVQMRTVLIHTSKNKGSTDVALIPEIQRHILLSEK